ncbi:MAG TPA: hypothetical protein VF805_11090 [Anaeromyxobacteraceae bacterium]
MGSTWVGAGFRAGRGLAALRPRADFLGFFFRGDAFAVGVGVAFGVAVAVPVEVEAAVASLRLHAGCEGAPPPGGARAGGSFTAGASDQTRPTAPHPQRSSSPSRSPSWMPSHSTRSHRLQT